MTGKVILTLKILYHNKNKISTRNLYFYGKYLILFYILFFGYCFFGMFS